MIKKFPIKSAFDLSDHVMAEDDHYHCKKCVVALFDDWLTMKPSKKWADRNAVCF